MPTNYIMKQLHDILLNKEKINVIINQEWFESIRKYVYYPIAIGEWRPKAFILMDIGIIYITLDNQFMDMVNRKCKKKRYGFWYTDEQQKDYIYKLFEWTVQYGEENEIINNYSLCFNAN